MAKRRRKVAKRSAKRRARRKAVRRTVKKAARKTKRRKAKRGLKVICPKCKSAYILEVTESQKGTGGIMGGFSRSR